MKTTGKIKIEAVTDVVCDVCLQSTRVTSGGLQYATLQAHWGYGAQHDGERYELQLCETCFFQTRSYLKQQQKIQNLFSDDESASEAADFGLSARDDFFGDSKIRD